jgi:hypothetical protein
LPSFKLGFSFFTTEKTSTFERLKMSNYDVFQFSIDKLKELFYCCPDSSQHIVERKRHIKYFDAYLNEISANTMVVEYVYIDGDFLDDYSSYYVKCFHAYERHCTRIHFFSNQFTKRKLNNVLRKTSASFASALQTAYLGFIVVKPLPRTVIGRTCLKTYSSSPERSFLATRQYDVNLFGISLSVNSLAYQEQDRVAAACATSALWSIFHKTGKLFHHPILSPIEITKIATSDSFFRNRFIPSEGLTIEQMAHAIREIGLESFPINANDEYILQSTIYAYMKFGMPIALAIYLVDASGATHQFFPNGGGHAVAVTGFRIDANRPAIPIGGSGFLSKASKISKLYVHDDQVGPFAKMEFDGAKVVDKGEQLNSLATNWTNFKGENAGVRAVPDTLLIPLYHKIRIPFEVVHKIIIDFDAIVEVYRQQNVLSVPQRIEWDIYLSSITSLKSDISKCDTIDPQHKIHLLTENMPKYLWRAAAYSTNNLLFELVFDATDIEQGDFFITSVYHDLRICTELRSIIATAIATPWLQPILGTPEKYSLKLLLANF